jgi:hypothetical protein
MDKLGLDDWNLWNGYMLNLCIYLFAFGRCVFFLLLYEYHTLFAGTILRHRIL